MARNVVYSKLNTNALDRQPKPIEWIASTKKDLKSFPKAVRTTFGQALFDAQSGQKHRRAKPLKGFGGAGVLEIVEDSEGDTYRAVYTVKFAGIVYVLHAFQKKSKSGIKTPQSVIELIRKRYREAEAHHAAWIQKQSSKDDSRHV